MTGRTRPLCVAVALTAAGTLLITGCTAQGTSAPVAATPSAAALPAYATKLQL
jgi:hypothetical protein